MVIGFLFGYFQPAWLLVPPGGIIDEMTFTRYCMYAAHTVNNQNKNLPSNAELYQCSVDAIAMDAAARAGSNMKTNRLHCRRGISDDYSFWDGGEA